MKKGYLILSNGTVFEGWKIGADRESVGEVVFTTGCVGYLETLTDPSYDGQIVVQTFPTIGIYGVIPEDFEGNSAVKGYIVRELCDTPSNFRSKGILDDFLKAQNVCGLCGIDTRALTRILREEGVMNGKISDTPDCDMNEIKNFRVTNVVAAVSSTETNIYKADGGKKYSVALIDYGAKHNILRCLQKRGCEITEYPFDTAAETILAARPDGVMLSNGPGDPAEDVICIEQINKLLGNVPLFGICLGHQLTALALGGQTVKLKYGHHGVNQPVRDVKGTRTFITSQNHGYAVVAESLKGKGSQIYVNANDGSNEGMEYPAYKAFTVQFHPEACGGPQDMEFLFDRFIQMMEDNKNAEE